MNQEIERKFSIKYLPDNLQINKAINIEQNFIYKDGITIIRLRKINDLIENKTEYVYTAKMNMDNKHEKDSSIMQKYEIENNISLDKYTELIDNKIYNTINKSRLVIPIKDNLKAEMDIYYGYLDGLITIEVEFPNREMAEKFEKPDWFGEELGYKKWSNRKLSMISKEEFKEMISEETIENNKNIVKKLKNVINLKT